MTTRLARYFDDYSIYHRTGGNKFCHAVGIPMIFVSILGLVGGLLGPSVAVVVLALAGIWYLVLDWKLAVSFLLVATGGLFLGRAMPISLNWALFGAGWIFQGIGHYVFEKKSPAFFRNLTHLLVGPL